MGILSLYQSPSMNYSNGLLEFGFERISMTKFVCIAGGYITSTEMTAAPAMWHVEIEVEEAQHYRMRMSRYVSLVKGNTTLMGAIMRVLKDLMQPMANGRRWFLLCDSSGECAGEGLPILIV